MNKALDEARGDAEPERLDAVLGGRAGAAAGPRDSHSISLRGMPLGGLPV